MKTENKDWKPEVGEKVWVVAFDRIHEMCITNILWERFYNGIISYNWATKEHNSEIQVKYVHPTPEAALASIMVYDLEGKEVVIPRAQKKNPTWQELDEAGHVEHLGSEIKWMLRDELGQHESLVKKLQKGWEVFEAYKASKGGQKPWGILEDIALRFSLTDESGMMNYTWEQCLEIAKGVMGAGAANGGESDQREGGS